MKLLEPSYKIMQQEPGLIGAYKMIELCGRISHKSEDKITDDSFVEFIDKMENMKHYATFEHGTIYLVIDISDENYHRIVNFYDKNPYSKVKYSSLTPTKAYITTNYRVIREWRRNDDLEYIVNEPSLFHEKRMTVIFTCDIGVSREYNRHRVDSILEESTRYCNYTKDKFGGELNVMIPVWLEERTKEIEDNLNRNNFNAYCNGFITGSQLNDIDYWLFANLCSEYCYAKLINDFKWTPQQARTILPLDTKTTLAHTAFMSDWNHFFDLRARGTTGAPHPSAKQLAEPLMHEILG